MERWVQLNSSVQGRPYDVASASNIEARHGLIIVYMNAHTLLLDSQSGYMHKQKSNLWEFHLGIEMIM